MTLAPLVSRTHQHARDWRVIVEETFETESSLVAFGSRENQPVVLKVIKKPGDEWRSGEVLEAFDGCGVARVYEQTPGAVLMERLRPGHSLVGIVLEGKDEEATDILADVIQQMSASESLLSERDASKSYATVEDWSRGFERYVASGDNQIPVELVQAGHGLYTDLFASQREPRLLHGDLHHYNILFDSVRGWLAIDPKGVIGELEYELGAILRNPIERPDLFVATATIERRLKQLTSRLDLNFERAVAWGFAQAVLSAIWDVEDGFTVDAANPALRLADAIRPML